MYFVIDLELELLYFTTNLSSDELFFTTFCIKSTNLYRNRSLKFKLCCFFFELERTEDREVKNGTGIDVCTLHLFDTICECNVSPRARCEYRYESNFMILLFLVSKQLSYLKKYVLLDITRLFIEHLFVCFCALT